LGDGIPYYMIDREHIFHSPANDGYSAFEPVVMFMVHIPLL
jgi:hypothetical protein